LRNYNENSGQNTRQNSRQNSRENSRQNSRENSRQNSRENSRQNFLASKKHERVEVRLRDYSASILETVKWSGTYKGYFITVQTDEITFGQWTGVPQIGLCSVLSTIHFFALIGTESQMKHCISLSNMD
jgi:hypothetical protein